MGLNMSNFNDFAVACSPLFQLSFTRYASSPVDRILVKISSYMDLKMQVFWSPKMAAVVLMHIRNRGIILINLVGITELPIPITYLIGTDPRPQRFFMGMNKLD